MKNAENYIKRYVGMNLVQESGDETDSWGMVSVENCQNNKSNNELSFHFAPRLDSYHSHEGIVQNVMPIPEAAPAEQVLDEEERKGNVVNEYTLGKRKLITSNLRAIRGISYDSIKRAKHMPPGHQE